VAARRASGDHDPLGVNSILAGMLLEPGDGSLGIAHHAAIVGLWAHAILDVHHRVPLAGQIAEERPRTHVLATQVPGAAVQEDDAKPRRGDARGRQPEITV
jgi:hypothetical protein